MEFVTSIPVECLNSGEAAAVWSGWSTFGDREVVREAAAKGTHIDLAYKCLAYRRHCTISDAQQYFTEEVEIWLNEMLNKQQIHRASHILQNTGKNPLQFIKEKCIECREPKLRKYLANYVIGKDGFDCELQESWNIMNSITQLEEKNRPAESLIEGVSIQEICQVPDDVKSALITELYFSTGESRLSDKLKNTVLWDYLLSNNKIDLIGAWIDARYSGAASPKNDAEIFPLETFNRMEIAEGMIEHVERSSAANPVKELVLNRLSGYGIFTKKEKDDVKFLLSRMFSNCKAPAEFSEILSRANCSVDRELFEKKIFSILNHCSESNFAEGSEILEKRLLELLLKICEEPMKNEEILQRAIVQNIEMLSPDLERYLQENPLIVLSLVYLEYRLRKREGEFELKEIFENGMEIDSRIIATELIGKSMENFAYLTRSLDAEAARRNDVTIYQLLNGYENIDVQRLFKWRHRKEPMPSFTSDNLMKKYGRKEKLTYIYYLKESRPSMAVYVLQKRQESRRDGLSSKMKYRAASYAHSLGLEDPENKEMMCSCVVFIEMLEVNSECLRLHATAADFVRKGLSLSIDDLLRRVSPNNPKDLETILQYLEKSFETFITEKTSQDPESFVEAMISWDFIVRFARAHNASPPCFFLEFLAHNNLWFEFVLVSHVFSYSLELALESVRHFESPSVRQHLSLALSNSHILTSRFVQNNLPKVKLDDLADATRSVTEHETYQDNEHENDLWLIILKCHQSQDPPRALLAASQTAKSPVLTVLAACYEPSSASAYCYSWLVVSVDNQQLTQEYSPCLGDQLWPARKVSQLFRSVLSLEYVATLSRAFHIFMPDNPLCQFFDFIVESVNLGEFKKAKDKLRDFVNVCASLKSNRSIDWENVETDYLNNSHWIVTVAVESTMIVLGKCLLSSHLQIKFLNILVATRFNQDLHIETPDFQTLLQIVTILTNTKTSFDFSSIRLTDEGSNVDAEIKRCIDELVQLEDFSSALQLSQVAGFNCSTIIHAQYRSEFKRSRNEGGKMEASFWKRCAEDLKKYGVTFTTAAFFVEHAEKVSSYKERYEILKLALETLEPIVTDKQILDTVEMAMWKSCILAGPDSIEIETESSVFDKLKSELLAGISELRVSCSLNDSAEESAVELLINRFIAAGQLATALRINTIFNYKHKELQILMLCLSLAEGEISPYQLTSQQRSLVSDTGRTKIRKYTTLRNRDFQKRSSVVSSLSGSSGNTTDGAETSNLMIQQIQLESLSMIDKLVKSLQSGFAIGTRILLCTKLATYLRRSYQSLLTLDDPMQLLYEVVGSNCDRKLEMVGNIIAAYRIKNETVAKFLAEEIVANTPRLVEESLEDSLVMWGNPLGGSIQAIIDLCNDPSLLGWELLKTANLSLGNSHVLTLKVAVELLIRAHDCFTASCSMEGIASILRKAQYLAYTLQQRKHWSLLVRLVTGLGRFTEMNYVFQILKENDQFEFLLGKGLDKMSGLKTALLEFCKRQCPGDKELFTLIALHFLLYKEIAFKWESEAKEIINEVVAEARKTQAKSSSGQQTLLKLSRNENVEKKLQVVVENFTHATEYYLQDNKLNLASRCSHQAQLAALQISLLVGAAQNHQVPCLFNLSPDELNKTLCQDLTLPQSLILVQAYNHHGDWSIAIYNHVVINGEIRYLKEFLACNLLSSAIVHDCVCRYRSERTITKQMTENMQLLVSELKDVECKYVLASQLGFKKIIEDLLANASTGSYLKDTVWKQGSRAKDFTADNYRG